MPRGMPSSTAATSPLPPRAPGSTRQPFPAWALIGARSAWWRATRATSCRSLGLLTRPSRAWAVTRDLSTWELTRTWTSPWTPSWDPTPPPSLTFRATTRMARSSLPRLPGGREPDKHGCRGRPRGNRRGSRSHHSNWLRLTRFFAGIKRRCGGKEMASFPFSFFLFHPYPFCVGILSDLLCSSILSFHCFTDEIQCWVATTSNDVFRGEGNESGSGGQLMKGMENTRLCYLFLFSGVSLIRFQT